MAATVIATLIATIEVGDQETVYAAREDGCACRYIKSWEGCLIRTEDLDIASGCGVVLAAIT